MPNVATAVFVAAVRQFQVLERSQLNELSGLQSRFADARILAKELIERGWLTPYQANLLLLGRGQELLLGSYVLLERLGEGGMGQVFKARNWKLGRIVALKMIRKDQLTSTAAVRRFQREVRAAAQLDHPNVIRAYDADEVGGQYLLAMEFIEEATDLARLVEKNGRLPVGDACEYIRQAALGLQHAHEKGMVHRDIKPHNLLLTKDGTTVKVLDMGLARLDSLSANDDMSSSMTQEGSIMGTADYISPEQAINPHTTDIRADIYSLGCTFYFLLTGTVPFPQGSFTEKLIQHQLDEPVAVEQHRSDIPTAVGAIVRKMMQKKPEDRFQIPADVAAALSTVQTSQRNEHIQVGTAHRVEHPDLLDTVSDHVIEPVRVQQNTQKRQWPVYAAVVGGSVVLLGIAVLLFLISQRAPNRTEHADKAKEVKTKTIEPAQKLLPPEVFQDFESGTYGDWKTTGTAFGRRPASGTLRGQQYVSGFGGKRLVNTFLSGDGSTGTLTSPEFTIKHSFINFRIGGGNKAKKTCIRLMVGGEMVRTATGNNNERLTWTCWDVGDLKGKKAVIEIVDQATGSWGHINVDDILFDDKPP